MLLLLLLLVRAGIVVVVLLRRTGPSGCLAWSSSSSSSSSSLLQQQQQQQQRTSRTAENWIAIAQHLQSNDLYNATAWADGCRYITEQQHADNDEDDVDDRSRRFLVTTREVDRAGEILTLHPIHFMRVVVVEEDPMSTSSLDLSSRQGRAEEMRGFALPRQDAELYRHSGLEASTCLEIFGNVRIQTPGWLGHLAASPSNNHTSSSSSTANCRIVPLWGAAPLCALAAVRPLARGEELVVVVSDETTEDDDDKELLESLSRQVLQRYAAEIAELRSYTTMAHAPPPDDDDDDDKTQHPVYHPIKRTYPGLTVLHPAQPEILQIEHFLTLDECRRLIHKARPHLQASLVTRDQENNKNTSSIAAVTTVHADDASRTSTNANVAQREIPTLIQRIVDLLQCPSRDHLETVQILHYAPGQRFVPHTDGWDRPVTACGFEQSRRLVTLFCYLNECRGGETHFSVPNVTVTPLPGRAVIHFPSAVAGSSQEATTTTVHESWPVLNSSSGSGSSEKWLLVAWMWQHVRSDPRYSEVLVPTLGEDVI